MKPQSKHSSHIHPFREQGPPGGRNSSVVTQMIPFRLTPDFQKRDHMRFRRQAKLFSQVWLNLDYSLQIGFSAVKKNHLDGFPGHPAVQRLLQESGRLIWLFILNPQSLKSKRKPGMQKPTQLSVAFFLTFIHIPTPQTLKSRCNQQSKTLHNAAQFSV